MLRQAFMAWRYRNQELTTKREVVDKHVPEALTFFVSLSDTCQYSKLFFSPNLCNHAKLALRQLIENKMVLLIYNIECRVNMAWHEAGRSGQVDSLQQTCMCFNSIMEDWMTTHFTS